MDSPTVAASKRYVDSLRVPRALDVTLVVGDLQRYVDPLRVPRALDVTVAVGDLRDAHPTRSSIGVDT